MTTDLKTTTNLTEYIAAGGNPDSGENQRICGKLVDREVLHCISSTVDLLLRHAEDLDPDVTTEELMDLSVAKDYEEAGREHVTDTMDRDDLIEWLSNNGHDLPNEFGELDDAEELDAGGKLTDDELRKMVLDKCDDWEEFCQEHDVEPHENEVYEHWAVTSWFARRLSECGEVTGDLLDFRVWGRTCTGQAIKMDYVIQRIAAGMEILDGQKNSWKD